MGKLQSSLGVPQAMIPPLFITVSLSEKSKASGRSCITVTIPLPLSESCPTKAVSVVNGKAVIDTSKCTSCGVCVGKCPFGAVPKEAASVCRIFVGGTWGKTQRMGTLLNNVYSADEVPTVIEKVMLWYKENGYVKERLGATVDRIGTDALEAAIATDDLITRKNDILAKPLLERQ